MMLERGVESLMRQSKSGARHVAEETIKIVPGLRSNPRGDCARPSLGAGDRSGHAVEIAEQDESDGQLVGGRAAQSPTAHFPSVAKLQSLLESRRSRCLVPAAPLTHPAPTPRPDFSSNTTAQCEPPEKVPPLSVRTQSAQTWVQPGR